MTALIFSVFLFISACSNDGGSSDSDDPSTHSVSGTISISGNTAVDSDVNDAWESAPLPQSNNSFEEAQLISTPVILGGYVTVAQSPMCASGGRLCASGDPSDFFRVTLNGDKYINLEMAHTIDVSLNLYDANQTLLDSVTRLSAANLSLNITDAAGDYFVEVQAQRGSSNYTLTIATSTEANTAGLSVDQDFVPGEFIVRFKGESEGLDLESNPTIMAQSMGLEVSEPSDAGPILVRIQEHQKSVLYENLGLQTKSYNIFENTPDLDQHNAKMETIQVIKAMRKHKDVLYAEPNYIRQTLAITPNDEFYRLQWHYPQISLPDAWDAIPAGSGPVVVAVVDTGVLMQHPDLAGQLTSDGYDFISDPSRANDGDGRDADPNDSGDATTNGNSSFHGTHVSGTIAAASNNGIGVAGVAWGTQTRIMPIRVMGVGGGTSSDIMEAVKYAAGLPNSSGRLPDQRADVINLSIGGPDSSAAEADIFAQVRAQGVIVVSAAGNAASNSPNYPAAYDGVVSVSAVNRYSELAPYSNYGSTIDVAAPGGDMLMNSLEDPRYPDGVVSTLGDDSNGGAVQYIYGFYEGTSMATPHVAGVAALMKAVAPELTPDAFDAHLINGDLTVDVGSPGRDNQFGHGLIDAYRAVLTAQDMDIPAALNVSPAALNFGTNDTTKTINAQILGTGSIGITSVSTDATWVTVTPSSGNLDSDPGTPGIPSTLAFQVEVERPQDFLDDTYRANITFETTANTVQVPVSMQKTSSNRSSNAGFHYIILVDPDANATKYSVVATAQNGQYQYRFDDVAPGRYQVYAGTDMDNDGQIGDIGEASGSYPSRSQPVTLNVNQDLSGIDFSSSFGVFLSNAVNSIFKVPDQQEPIGSIAPLTDGSLEKIE